MGIRNAYREYVEAVEKDEENLKKDVRDHYRSGKNALKLAREIQRHGEPVGDPERKKLLRAFREGAYHFGIAGQDYEHLGENKRAIVCYKKVLEVCKEIDRYNSSKYFRFVNQTEKIGAEINLAGARAKAALSDKGKKRLERVVAASVILISFLMGLLVLSPSLTGNVIGNMAHASSNWIGAIFFLIGTLGLFLYLRKR